MQTPCPPRSSRISLGGDSIAFVGATAHTMVTAANGLNGIDTALRCAAETIEARRSDALASSRLK